MESGNLKKTQAQGVPGQAPEAPTSVDEIVAFVKNLCLTYSHLTYYPSTHPIAVKQMQAAWAELQAAMRQFGEINISLTEGKLLFFGMPVEERNPVVSKFSHHFETLHIHSIRFRTGILAKEFISFFKFFCQDPKSIEDQGGIEKILKEQQVEHISFNAAVYKVIGEDEKIVKKSEIYRGQSKSDGEAKTEVLRYFLEKILDHSQDETALLDEIKNDPEKLAAQIVKLVEQLGTDGKYDKDSMVEALLQNIQMVSETMGRAPDAGADVEKETVANAMLVFENELKRKSQNLSSGASVKFIKRITDVVSSYTDKFKAGKILDEFLSHEKSLKSAEKMMKELNVSGGESGKRILTRIREVMKEKGMDEEELLNYLNQSADVPPKERHKRKIAKDFQPLADRIKGKIDSDFKDLQNKDQLVEYLNNTMSREVARAVKERTAQLEHEVENMKAAMANVHQLFNDVNLGIIIVDKDNRVVVAEHPEKLPCEVKLNEPLPEPLANELVKFKAEGKGSLDLPSCSICQVELDEQNKIHAFLFQFE